MYLDILLNYYIGNASILNEIYSFANAGQTCLNDGRYSSVLSQCGNTAGSFVSCFGVFKKNTTTLSVPNNHFVQVTMDSDNLDHTFIIINIEKTYYILQSFLNLYPPLIKKIDKSQIESYIDIILVPDKFTYNKNKNILNIKLYSFKPQVNIISSILAYFGYMYAFIVFIEKNWDSLDDIDIKLVEGLTNAFNIKMSGTKKFENCFYKTLNDRKLVVYSSLYNGLNILFEYKPDINNSTYKNNYISDPRLSEFTKVMIICGQLEIINKYTNSDLLHTESCILNATTSLSTVLKDITSPLSFYIGFNSLDIQINNNYKYWMTKTDKTAHSKKQKIFAGLSPKRK